MISLTSHLFVHKFEQALTACQDPSVHDIGVRGLGSRIKAIVYILNLLEQSDLALEELVAVP